MLKNYKLEFNRGDILTSKMLDRLYKYPKEIFEISYTNHSDGVITGMDIIKKEDSNILTQGILKYNTEYYVLDKDIILDEILEKMNIDEGSKYDIYFDLEKDLSASIKCSSFSINISISDEERRNSTLYMGTFMNSSKSNIDYADDIKDLILRNNIYLDRIYVKQSGYKKDTFTRDICDLVLNLLQNKKNPHPMDYMIINDIIRGEVVEYDMIVYYVNQVSKIDVRGLDRKEVLDKFYKALNTEYVIYASQKDEVKKEVKSKHMISGGVI